MAAPLNAIDAIAPAWTRAHELLFKPFRWGFWWRMAVVAFLTGEVSGGNFNIPTNWNTNTSSSTGKFVAESPLGAMGAAAIALIVVAALVFALVFMYLSCVFRFVLFDVVLTGRYRLREGFGRWHQLGARFFWWSLAYTFLFILACGLPVLLIVADWQPMQHGSGAAIVGVMVGVLIVILVALAGALIFVLTKDFVLPIMAFDSVGTAAAWGTLRRMMMSDPTAYLGYIGMKIVLAMASGFVMAIVGLLLLLCVGLPIGIIIGIIIVAAPGANAAVGIALAVVIGGIALLALFFLMGLLGAPVATFFEAYAVYFFGHRFRPMEMVMYPEPPVPPPAPVEPAPVAPPPLSPGPEPSPA